MGRMGDSHEEGAGTVKCALARSPTSTTLTRSRCAALLHMHDVVGVHTRSIDPLAELVPERHRLAAVVFGRDCRQCGRVPEAAAAAAAAFGGV
mmetsp:Transcript_14495/g.57803  ORF Transcript_14495/g.57803 Transcript_14495/m.57803 type:complete len:93 (-) Transcript_14495:1767-2045(-)